jgi:hypothetical protein
VKRVLFVSDLHCGSYHGLVPPSGFAQCADTPKLKLLHEEMWARTMKWCSAYEADLLVVNGDAIDGKMSKNSGIGGIVDLWRQVEMAAECIKAIKAKAIVMTRGTPYHTQIEGQNCEDLVAQRVGARIENSLLLEIEGVTVDIRHFCGRSSTANGQFAPVSRERILQALEAERDRNYAKVYVRSHVHRHCYCGEGDLRESSGWLCMTTPALQCRGVAYGALRCSGRTDFGVVWGKFNKGNVTWEVKAERLEGERRELVKL